MSSGYDSADQGAATPVFAANSDTLKNKTGVWLDKCKESACQYHSDTNTAEQLIQYLDKLKSQAKL